MSVSSANRVYVANSAADVRQDVAWRTAVRWSTAAALWAIGITVVLPAGIDFPLRAVAPFALAAAVCRTLALTAPSPGPRLPQWLAGAVLAADAALLTGLLDITGGPFNPFIVVYGVYVWLAVVSLPAGWAAGVGLVCTAGFGWLVVDHLRAGHLEHHRLNDFPTHLFTMGFAGAAIAELVGHYIDRNRADLAERQGQLDTARDRAMRSERLAALTTLAAGAAHELSTPLATIAVASRELQRSADRLAGSSVTVDAIRDDAHLIRSEIDRCHRILDGMSGRAGDWVPGDTTTGGAIAALAKSRLPEDQQRRLGVTVAPQADAVPVPSAAIAQALASLLRNAFDASRATDEVSLDVTTKGSMLCFTVQDRGAGMPDDVRRRAGEPFFTTKPGRGMGLGLFLARSIAEQAGGSLELSGGPGTTAVLEIPTTPPGAGS